MYYDQDPVIIDLNRYLDRQQDYTEEEQLHDLDGFIEYAQKHPTSDCANAICNVATEACLGELLDFVDTTFITDDIDSLRPWQRRKLLDVALRFTRAIGDALIDGYDLTQRG